MKLLKALNRCGCEQKRLGMTDATVGPWSCCGDCGNAPMLYGLLAACDYYLPNGELILGKGITYLRKDCITGCSYSSRWFNDGGLIDDEPIIENGTIRECTPTLDEYGNIVAIGSLDLPEFNGDYGPDAFPWGTPRNTVVEELCGQPIAVAGDFAKWYTDRTSEEFTLELETRDGYRATWTAATETCLTYATLHRTYADIEVAFLPSKLCVIPIESEPRQCCDDAESQCRCNDPGVICGNDCDDDKTISLTLAGCDGQLAFDGTLSSPRFWDASTWPTGITYPSPAPCGAFLFTASTGDDCLNNLKLVLWCDGSDYHVEAYCFNTQTSAWVSQGEGDVDVVNECAGPRLAFTLPPLACCCVGVTVDCCEEPIPATLSWEVTTTSPCIEGPLSGTFEYNENTGWTVLFDPVDCNILALYLDCVIIEGTPYFQVLLQIRDSIDVTSQYTALVATGDVQCSPFELSTVLTDSSEGAAICCAGETLTLTVTEAA